MSKYSRIGGARRRIGKATIYLTATDRETPDRRWIYEVRIVVKGKALWEGEIHSEPGGVVVRSWESFPPPCDRGERLVEKRVGLDSPDAFDSIARSAISINSVFCKDDPDPPIEVCDAINEATLEALDQNDRYVVKRI